MVVSILFFKIFPKDIFFHFLIFDLYLNITELSLKLTLNSIALQ